MNMLFRLFWICENWGAEEDDEVTMVGDEDSDGDDDSDELVLSELE